MVEYFYFKETVAGSIPVFVTNGKFYLIYNESGLILTTLCEVRVFETPKVDKI